MDAATEVKMAALREDLLEQFAEVREGLDTKINDVERKSLSFAQRAASRQAEEKPASVKENLQKKMKARYGGLISKTKDIKGAAALG